MSICLSRIPRSPCKAFATCGVLGAILGAASGVIDSKDIVRLVCWQALVLGAAGAGMSCLARWQEFAAAREIEQESRVDRRRALGRPAIFFALVLLSIAGICLWRLFEIPRGYHCGLPAAMMLGGAAFFVAAAVGVICLDMLIRWID